MSTQTLADQLVEVVLQVESSVSKGRRRYTLNSVVDAVQGADAIDWCPLPATGEQQLTFVVREDCV